MSSVAVFACHELVLSATHRLVALNGASLTFSEISQSSLREPLEDRG
jgi:hypothetical protein